MSADLTQLRQQIDALDTQLLALLNQRAALARSVGERKGGAPAYRPEREAEILRRVQQSNPGPLPAERAVAVFREIISACRGMEQHIRVAFLGPQGTFSESAARQQFGAAVDYVPEASIDAVFRAVASGSTEFAVVPVENSTEGAISRTLDLLLNTPASAVRFRTWLRIKYVRNRLNYSIFLQKLINIKFICTRYILAKSYGCNNMFLIRKYR